MTTDPQVHQRMSHGFAYEEDLYGRMAHSLMPLFHAHGFLACMHRRDHASHPWGPATIAYQRSVDPGLLDAFSTRPHDRFRAIGGVASASETCQVRLSLLRSARADPFNEDERR